MKAAHAEWTVRGGASYLPGYVQRSPFTTSTCLEAVVRRLKEMACQDTACQDTEEMCLAISRSCIMLMLWKSMRKKDHHLLLTFILIFYASDLYRLLMASEQHQSLEEIGRYCDLIEERIGDSSTNSINPVPDISYQSRGHPNFNI